MAYIMIEASVRTHRKFLAAGPAASWLWVCGLGYCQDGLTDGLIPVTAVEFLGVRDPSPLIDKLVQARLWDVVDGGWQMHDYLEHNRSAEEIRSTMRARQLGGRLGGRPVSTARVPTGGDASHQPVATARAPGGGDAVPPVATARVLVEGDASPTARVLVEGDAAQPGCRRHESSVEDEPSRTLKVNHQGKPPRKPPEKKRVTSPETLPSVLPSVLPTVLPTGTTRSQSVSAEPAPRADSTPPVRVLCEFPCIGTHGPVWRLTDRQLATWAELYPGLDVHAEARKALAWVQANPSRRKTAEGMPRFLVNWFNREINRWGRVQAPERRELADRGARNAAVFDDVRVALDRRRHGG